MPGKPSFPDDPSQTFTAPAGRPRFAKASSGRGPLRRRNPANEIRHMNGIPTHDEVSSLVLRRDPIWSKVAPDRSFEEFAAQADPLQCRQGAPEIVRSRFENVRALVRLSYVDYGLLDVALEYTLHTFEQALRLRCEEFGTTLVQNPTLADLIRQASRHHLFEDSQEAAEVLRLLRNEVAHPAMDSRYALTAIPVMVRVVDVVNELYGDARSRRMRDELRSEINAVLMPLASEGAVASGELDEAIIYCASVVHVEMHDHEPRIDLAVWPINDPTKETTDVEPIVYRAKSWEMSRQGLIFELDEDSARQLVVRPLVKESSVRKFRQWKAELERGPSSYHHALLMARHEIRHLRSASRRRGALKGGVK
jgi:hypothetical protein